MKYGDVSRLASALIYTCISDKVLFLRSKIGYILLISPFKHWLRYSLVAPQ